jgi:hypothetical protein
MSEQNEAGQWASEALDGSQGYFADAPALLGALAWNAPNRDVDLVAISAWGIQARTAG